MSKTKAKLKDFDKYYYYQESVQSPETDVQFFRDTYKELKKKDPVTLCEDFCGTYKICCEWTKLDKDFLAVGVDLDEEPIEYGTKNYFPELNEQQQSRVKILHDNVMADNIPSADIIAALNFSYFIFKERKMVKEYFASAYKRLNEGGLFIADCFGGPDCMQQNEEETPHDGFSYFWDQDSFDPITNYAQFYIHFKRKGEKKREQVFSYDWRMWSIPELKDILTEVGFKNVHTYWEDDDEDGDGNGEFIRVTKGEEVEAWVAYLVAEK